VVFCLVISRNCAHRGVLVRIIRFIGFKNACCGRPSRSRSCVGSVDDCSSGCCSLAWGKAGNTDDDNGCDSRKHVSSRA